MKASKIPIAPEEVKHQQLEEIDTPTESALSTADEPSTQVALGTDEDSNVQVALAGNGERQALEDDDMMKMEEGKGHKS